MIAVMERARDAGDPEHARPSAGRPSVGRAPALAGAMRDPAAFLALQSAVGNRAAARLAGAAGEGSVSIIKQPLDDGPPTSGPDTTPVELAASDDPTVAERILAAEDG
jgi:hypothetical protein